MEVLKNVELVLQEEIKIQMWIGLPEAYVNGVRVYLQVPPTIKNGRTFVPVRFVSESLKSEVKWDGDTRSVTVIGPEHTCIVMIDQTKSPLGRNEILEYLQAQGIAGRPGTHSVVGLEAYRKGFGTNPADYPVATQVEAESMALPLHNHMGEDDIERVIRALEEI